MNISRDCVKLERILAVRHTEAGKRLISFRVTFATVDWNVQFVVLQEHV